MPVTIRDVTAGDKEGVRVLLTSVPEAGRWSDPSVCQSQQGTFCRLAECDDGEICGLIAFRITADEAEILNLAVHSSQRRKGIASHLIDEVAAKCKSAGVTKIFLEVRESNEAARSFYARMSFAKAGRRRGYYREPVEDALVLVRTIK